jgi:4-amino-4-deoxy-L-arabinose transferase-like glycosyltransferase
VLYDYLLANRGSADWIVAVQGANEAAQIELATGQPVMAMGGFTGTDPAPTLAQLQEYVGSGRLRYVIVGGAGGPGGPGDGGPAGGRGTTGEIAQWVASHGSLVESVSGVSLYDLSAAS